MRAFFVCSNIECSFSPLREQAREGANLINTIYRLETRYTRSSSRVTPASRNFPLSLKTS